MSTQQLHSAAKAVLQRRERGADLGGQPGGRRPGASALAPGAEAAPAASGAEPAGAVATARTGEPGTPAGASNAAGVKGDHLADTVRTVLAERPDFKVPGEDGKPTSAADLLRQAQEEATRETADFQKAVTAATNCFGRRGA